VLGRAPSPGERNTAMKYLEKTPGDDGWTAIVHALFASSEFRYLN
jgi:hypothetical protein